MKSFTPSSFLFVTATLWLLGLTKSMTTAASCMGNEEVVEFTFFLDEDSIEENGWSLTCDGLGTVWNVPVGSIESSFRFQDPEAPFVTQQVCIPLDTSCYFTLEDSYGDGLVSPGYFYLTYGATTLIVSKEQEEFYEKTSCFGPTCNVEPQEMAEQCDNFYLYFQANDLPEQNTVRVECDGEIIFVKSDFQEPQQATEFEQCIPSHKCCNVAVNDADNSNGLQGVELHVEWAGKVILTYDTSDQDASGSIHQSFGVTCAAATTQPPAGGDNVDTDTNEDVDTNPASSSQNTTTNSHAQKSMNAPTFTESGGFIALVVVGSLLAIGILVALVSWNSHSSNEVRAGKDLDLRSTGSKETEDLDEEA